MSDYAHSTMNLDQLQYEMEILELQRDAELSVNCQGEANECQAKIESIQKQINEIPF